VNTFLAKYKYTWYFHTCTWHYYTSVVWVHHSVPTFLIYLVIKLFLFMPPLQNVLFLYLCPLFCCCCFTYHYFVFPRCPYYLLHMPWKQSCCRCKSDVFSKRLMVLYGFLGYYQFPGYRTQIFTFLKLMETIRILWGPLSLGPETTNILISSFVKYSVQMYFGSFNVYWSFCVVWSPA